MRFAPPCLASVDEDEPLHLTLGGMRVFCAPDAREPIAAASASAEKATLPLSSALMSALAALLALRVLGHEFATPSVTALCAMVAAVCPSDVRRSAHDAWRPVAGEHAGAPLYYGSSRPIST